MENSLLLTNLKCVYFTFLWTFFFNQDWSGIVRGRNNSATVKQRKPARLILIDSVHTSTLLYFENLSQKVDDCIDMAAGYGSHAHKIYISPLSVWQLIDTWLNVSFFHSFIFTLVHCHREWVHQFIKFTLCTFRLARNLHVTKCLHSFIQLFISW